MPKQIPGGLEFTHDEAEDLFQSTICTTCGGMHPTWAWAQRKNTCPECKDYPSNEDIAGRTCEHTPADYTPRPLTPDEQKRWGNKGLL